MSTSTQQPVNRQMQRAVNAAFDRKNRDAIAAMHSAALRAK